MADKPELIVVTPVRHIKGLHEKLASRFTLLEYPDPLFEDVESVLSRPIALFTNPNKSKLPIDAKVLGAASNLKMVTTASTGLVHIDLKEAERRGVAIRSLTKEFETIERISSTAELALGLTMAAVRNIPAGFQDVLAGNWDYEKFIGRQFNALTVGVVGYGRLGRKYARYLDALDSRVLVCDPYKSADDCPYPLVSLDEIARECDIVALHVHVSDETRDMIGEQFLSQAKPDLVLVNTSRGELVDEAAVVDFLHRNPEAKVATDVLYDELRAKWNSPFLAEAQKGGNVLITPHIGGMCREAQEIAYHRAADLLIEWLDEQQA